MAFRRFGQVVPPATTKVKVEMNEVQFLRFRENNKNSFVTVDLNNYSAVAIVSQSAAIIAHIAARPNTSHMNNPQEGDQNVQAKMDEFAAFFNQQRNFFSPGQRTWVISALYAGDIAMSDHKAIIERNIKRMELSYANVAYLELKRELPLSAAQGTIFIDARKESPIVYVGNNRINL
ncbi:MAG: hypothetical protein M1834_003354 [Cirrosporium novae-zelandiae]|nr:MAG: hypothetical protein M1834_003354 [Cirrosporium novae-zelandiae]